MTDTPETTGGCVGKAPLEGNAGEVVEGLEANATLSELFRLQLNQPGRGILPRRELWHPAVRINKAIVVTENTVLPGRDTRIVD